VSIDKNLQKPAIGFGALHESSGWIVHGDDPLFGELRIFFGL
jgi:hypothetical protein